MRKLLIILALCAIPAFGQLGNATKLRGTNICAGTPSNTQVLTYSSSNGCWQASAAGGGGTRIYGTMFVSQSGALTSGFTAYLSVPSACTIVGWDIQVDTGTATVDVWKIASGTAIPTISNTITASAIPAIATGTAIHSTTLTGWTTAVSANDILGFNLKVVSSATQVGFQLECQ